MNSNLKESFIKLPNSWYDNLSISNKELTTLSLLYRNYTYYQSVSLCSLEMLCNYMYIDSNTNKKIINDIKNTFSLLKDKETILNYYDLHYNNIELNDITNKNQVFYIELIHPPEDNYFMVKNIDINKIFKSLQGSNLSKNNLIRYFIACMRVINNEAKFGYLTQSKLKKLVNDSKTIQKYNKILQDDLNLIRYNNNYLTEEKHYSSTFIGLYENEYNFNKQVEFEVERQGLIFTNKTKSNLNRSITQKNNNKKEI